MIKEAKVKEGKPKFPCKKIKAGTYEYRGWIISSVGYYHPEQKVCWEGVDPETQSGDFHGYSKRQIKNLIDKDFERTESKLSSKF
jgi:hypothetical protein